MTTGPEAIAQLKELQEQGLWYARDSQATPNTDPIHDSSCAVWLDAFNSLGFESPQSFGYKVAQAQQPWESWADKFNDACQGLLAYRATFDQRWFTESKLPVSTYIDASGISIYSTGAESPNDPMTTWYEGVAVPQLRSLATRGAIDWLLTPVREGAQALGPLGEYFWPLAIVVVVILFLVLAIKVT